MRDYDPPVDFSRHERDRGEVMRQRIDGNENDGILNLLDDLRDADMPELPWDEQSEPEEPPEPEGPPQPEELPEEEPEPTARAFIDMMASARRPLYPGAKMSQLDGITQLLADKCMFESTRASFEKTLSTVGNMLPEGHCLPKTMYETKKILKALKMDYVTYDVCPKLCLLFWKDYADDKYCAKCGHSRYHEVDVGNGQKRQTKVAIKILRYLPFIKRIQRLYMFEETAKQMTWHKTGIRLQDEKKRVPMVHPSDGQSWKHFDEKHPNEASEARNVRIAIATDGFNPYGMSTAAYSCWPVFVIPLNLPPGVVMQRKNIFLSMILPGPEYPGKKLSVLMQPLVDDLHHSWHHGTLTYDRASKRNFIMKVWFHYSMHDLPGYALFCGHSTAGKFPCPVCRHELEFRHLKAGHKYVAFDKHRKFLSPGHRFRSDKKNFTKGVVVLEHKEIPKFNGATVDAELRALQPSKEPGHQFEGYGKTHNWTHIAGITELEYYKDLELPHNIDMMHTEKNCGEAFLNTCCNIPGKSRDNVSARVDIEEICDRVALHMQPPEGNRKGWLKPHAKYCLDSADKKEAFTWLKYDVMFPDGYCSNMSKGVNLATGKINGLKSHDYHIWIERLMPVMLRGYLPDHVWRVLAEVSHFFRTVCAKQICTEVIEKLQKQVPDMLCKLEMIFPPGFFTPMLHLIVHLANEALLGGPVQYRWQFCIEREFKYIRYKCGNKNKIEACIAEATLLHEMADATTMYYANDVPTKHNPVARYNSDEPNRDPKLLLFKYPGGKAGASKVENISPEEKDCIMLYVLMNMEEVVDFMR
jgi:hypothetical protein